MSSRTALRVTVALACAAASTAIAAPAAAEPWPKGPEPRAVEARAAAAADALVAANPVALRRGPGDALARTKVHTGTRGLNYVSYERTHRGLPVVGGDAVVVTDAAGTVRHTAVALDETLDVNVTPTVDAATAAATSSRQKRPTAVADVSAPRLAVLAWTDTPLLVWETVVTGDTGGVPTKLHVFVDATTGAVVDSYDEVRAGSGTGFYNGAVDIDTSPTARGFLMTDESRPGVQCGGQDGRAFASDDDDWGNGRGPDLETACVDTMFAIQQEANMMRDWFGREGIDGEGGGFPARVGLPQVNAYWTGSYAMFGRSADGQRQATPTDVVAHEMGHAIFQTTPGGAGSSNENGGINEAAGDIFGALTEAYVNNPDDPPDYMIGEEADLSGEGPIRIMHKPSELGDPDCWSNGIAGTEVHAAAGPLNHWFYLLAEGTDPGGGKPGSPTCDGSVIEGLGIRAAGEIFYNSLLTKTSNWRYVDIRTASLTAARNLYPGSCAEFNVVKAAWNAITVPVQTGEPSCSATGNDYSLTVAPGSDGVAAGSSVTFTVHTEVTAGSAQAVTLSATGLPDGATASFEPTEVRAGESAELTITTSPDTPVGSYPLVLGGTGEVEHTVGFILAVGGPPGCAGANSGDVEIPDAGDTVESHILITGCDRAASATASVTVGIQHTYRGDLLVELVAPDGTAKRLKDSDDQDRAQNVTATYEVDLSGQPAEGLWVLRVRDVFQVDVGYIDTWTLTL